MEAQARYAQVSQSTALVVLIAALILGVVGGYELRGFSIGEDTRVNTPADAGHTVLIPRSVREGYDITPYQAPAPRTTHEDDTTGK
jgi:hypothetical protein